MACNSFRIKAILRVILLAVAIMAFVFSINQHKWYVATGVSAIIIIIVLIELFQFIDRSNRQFRQLLLSLKHQDFTQSYQVHFHEKSFRDLEDTFNEILKNYRDAKIEREVHYQYLQFIINHIDIAILCYRKDGQIELLNPSARNLLNLNRKDTLDSLKKTDLKIYELLKTLSAGESKLIKILLRGELMQLLVHATEFKLQEIPYKLISLKDIRNEMEEQELESWQKLIRVLTHEIMNSVTPVSSLSTAINEMLTEEDGKRKSLSKIPPDDFDDMYESLKTIEERSRGLLNFIGSYKNLTRLPMPNFQNIPVKDLLNHVENLMKKVMEKNRVTLTVTIPAEGLQISADKDMVQQVLINLIINAKDAVARQDDKQVTLGASRKDGKILIYVTDNGPGIDQENIDKLFIPFFTTKKNGSGIGLSLARQIMRLHKGRISFQTHEQKGTTFTLEF